MLTAIRKFKLPKSRKLYIYNDKKVIDIIMPFWGWISHTTKPDTENYPEIRNLTMQNLYWLLGADCSYDEWLEYIEDWDKSRHIYNVEITKLPESLFFSEEEKQTAIDSFHNI